MEKAPRIYYIIRLHESCSQITADYLVNSLKDGAGLDLYQTKSKRGGLILHLTASNDRILEIASRDLMIKKRDIHGILRRFTPEEKEFEENLDGIVGPLTLSDVQHCISYAFESVHFNESIKTLPGCGGNHKLIIKCGSIIHAYKDAGLIETLPVHDEILLNSVYSNWNSILNPPLDQIRNYFGENVALYFSFLSFYTLFLIPISALGILQFLLDKVLGIDFLFSNVFFACLNLISVTIFLELWKRRNNDHAYDWGTFGKLRHKKPRPEFRGTIHCSPVTGERELYYPIKETLKRALFISFPCIFLCLVVAFIMMLLSFQMDLFFMEFCPSLMFGDILLYVPSALYGILIFIFNRYYLHWAHYLTEWENHRTQEQFEKWVVYKLVVFEFVNSFISLFYIAFVIGDISTLKSQIFMMLITIQLTNQLMETVLPILLRWPSSKKVMSRISSKIVTHSQHNGEGLCEPLNETLGYVDLELKRDPYESTYDDLMELWLQFGHVFLFSSVYPMAATLALINNLCELKLDKYKLKKLMRKPTPRPTRDLGAWYDALNMTVIFSIMTNLALIAMDPDVKSFAPEMSQGPHWFLVFVVLEHIFLFVKVMIEQFIPDVSTRVKIAMDRDRLS